ncbi:MAG: hypothetical protein AAF721_20965 [Myxococcota bacterium]
MRRFSLASKILLTVGLSFGLAACVTAESESDVAPSSAQRGPLGKADAPGSCLADDGSDHCGGPSDGACWCDEACASYGDCCADKQPVCDGVDPGPTLCMSDDTCADGEFCDHTQCLSNCPDGFICPAVCWGACEEIPQPPQCPDICEAVCAGEPEPPLPVGCPTPSCDCPDPEPEPDSCADACGGKSDGACWCDDQCTNFGDCCDDFEDECAEPVDVCEQLAEDFAAETAEIRSCTADAECGQVLAGTSCGCTRNWVARTDADLTDWTELQTQAAEEGCPIPGGISTCDCPAADGFACDAGICTWNYL